MKGHPVSNEEFSLLINHLFDGETRKRTTAFRRMQKHLVFDVRAEDELLLGRNLHRFAVARVVPHALRRAFLLEGAELQEANLFVILDRVENHNLGSFEDDGDVFLAEFELWLRQRKRICHERRKLFATDNMLLVFCRSGSRFLRCGGCFLHCHVNVSFLYYCRTGNVSPDDIHLGGKLSERDDNLPYYQNRRTQNIEHLSVSFNGFLSRFFHTREIFLIRMFTRKSGIPFKMRAVVIQRIVEMVICI